jgi:hypothetical protein
MRGIALLLAFCGTSCMTLTREGGGVAVYQASPVFRHRSLRTVKKPAAMEK